MKPTNTIPRMNASSPSPAAPDAGANPQDGPLAGSGGVGSGVIGGGAIVGGGTVGRGAFGGATATVKALVRVSVPAEVVTETSLAPIVASAATLILAVIWVELSTVKL